MRGYLAKIALPDETHKERRKHVLDTLESLFCDGLTLRRIGFGESLCETYIAITWCGWSIVRNGSTIIINAGTELERLERLVNELKLCGPGLCGGDANDNAESNKPEFCIVEYDSEKAAGLSWLRGDLNAADIVYGRIMPEPALAGAAD